MAADDWIDVRGVPYYNAPMLLKLHYWRRGARVGKGETARILQDRYSYSSHRVGIQNSLAGLTTYRIDHGTA